MEHTSGSSNSGSGSGKEEMEEHHKDAPVIIDILDTDDEIDYGESDDDDSSVEVVEVGRTTTGKTDDAVEAARLERQRQRGEQDKEEDDLHNAYPSVLDKEGKEDEEEEEGDLIGWDLGGNYESGGSCEAPGEEDEEGAIEYLTVAGEMGNRWCDYPEVSEIWLRAFLYGEGVRDEMFWASMKEDTYRCLACLEAYTKTRACILDYLRSHDGNDWAELAWEAEGRINRLDKGFIRRHLQETRRKVEEREREGRREGGMLDEEESDVLMFALLDMLTHCKICMADGGFDEILVAIMEKVGGDVKMNEEVLKGRRVQGVYTLMTHNSDSIRAWAGRTAKGMGKVTREMLMGEGGIDVVVREWVWALEEEYFD